SPIGRKAAAATRPVHSGLWVRAVMTNPRATVCIQEPTLDTRAADHTRAKLRERSGRNDEKATAGGYRWRDTGAMELQEAVERARTIVAASRRIVVLTGAGI